MIPLSPSIYRAAQAPASVLSRSPPKWREAADELGFLILGSSLIWMLAALTSMILR